MLNLYYIRDVFICGGADGELQPPPKMSKKMFKPLRYFDVFRKFRRMASKLFGSISKIVHSGRLHYNVYVHCIYTK